MLSTKDEVKVRGAGLPLYHAERVIQETGEMFGDGSHIIYVNGSYKNDEEPIGKLMHDFRCSSSVDMFYPLLANQMKYFKETEGGREKLCKAVEELAEKRAAEAALKVHVTYFMKGTITLDTVMAETGLSEKEVEAIVEEIKTAQES